MRKPGLIWRTVRYLTVRQLVFQVLTRLRSRPRLRLPRTAPAAYFLKVPDAEKPISWQTGTFLFLNQSYSPGSQPINWNYRHAGAMDYGKLWTYNLNYFDFLNQPGMSPVSGVRLIHDFIRQSDALQDGLEAYPTSLRIINWVEFLSRNRIQQAMIDRHLFAQVTLLRHRLEYAIGGNHLLENGYALLLGALYFRHQRWFRLGARLVRSEMNRQILTDGGHDERSPMYHQLLLDRLLTVLLALQHDTWHKDAMLVHDLSDKACQMLRWLTVVTFRNGDIPLVNDSVLGVAPTTAQLLAKAERVLGNRFGLTRAMVTRLQDSGYRMFRTDRYELFADVGPVGPDHQPGHAHADTLSFVLHVDNLPLVVDKGVSTYQIGPRRDRERSTAAHNTVCIDSVNSSEVWSGFRVGLRARVIVLTDTPTKLTARHDGYRRLGVIHERTWAVEPNRLLLTDRLIGIWNHKNRVGTARFYLHPDVRVQLSDDRILVGPLQLSVSSETQPVVSVINYGFAEGFNRLRTGQCLEVLFTDYLDTTMWLIE
ncbi:heparinase [Spirosoma radiotolerans]|uniref:Heparinase n=1 Tax=Spirosoma radiotolerans TaxID=1379870 RepID=A0A0E4A1P9_9BACT|nr:heparinase [Spirosoma radiotolerans]